MTYNIICNVIMEEYPSNIVGKYACVNSEYNFLFNTKFLVDILEKFGLEFKKINSLDEAIDYDKPLELFFQKYLKKEPDVGFDNYLNQYVDFNKKIIAGSASVWSVNRFPTDWMFRRENSDMRRAYDVVNGKFELTCEVPEDIFFHKVFEKKYGIHIGKLLLTSK